MTSRRRPARRGVPVNRRSVSRQRALTALKRFAYSQPPKPHLPFSLSPLLRTPPTLCPVFDRPPNLTKPGLFVTATDTEVGKTVITCAIAALLRRAGLTVGVSKPLASGCRRDREGLVSEDAEALAHFADCRQPLDVIHPLRYVAPLAPAVAAELTGEAPDWSLLADRLERLDAASDAMLIEGIGGLLVPIDPADAQRTVLDLIVALGYPVVVVTRANLGTLNHTAMTVRLLREAGCKVAGLVVNGYPADPSTQSDESVATNRQWLAKMTRVPVLATVPRCEPNQVKVHKGVMPYAIIDAVGMSYWPDLVGVPDTGAGLGRRRG